MVRKGTTSCPEKVRFGSESCTPKLRRWRLMDSTTPIQPVIIGANQETLALSEALREGGIWVPAIRPPTVLFWKRKLRPKKR